MANPRKRATSTRPTTPSAEQNAPESLLWAYRLQKEHRKTNQRLDDGHFKLKASILHADTRVNGLHEDFKALSDSLKLLSSHQKALQRKVLGLERHVDEVNPRKANKQLSADIETLAQDQEDGLTALGQHFIFLRSEIQAGLADLRADVSSLQDFSREKPSQAQARPDSPVDSNATTVDTVHAMKKNCKANINIESDFCMVPEQGDRHLEEHLEMGQTMISEQLRKYEEDLCKSFVAGLTEQGYQAVLRSRLRKVGWTWDNVHKEIGPMLRRGDRRLRGGKVRKLQ